jgi:hypothetical protein
MFLFSRFDEKLRDFCTKNSDTSNIREIAKRLVLKELWVNTKENPTLLFLVLHISQFYTGV